jgi:hypothetical protein
MRAVTAFVAVLGVLGVVMASGPARADDDDYDGGWRQHQWHEHERMEQRWREHEWRERAWHSYGPPPVAYPAQGYYVPQPTYYAPPRAYYAVPPSAYYTPPPPQPVYEAPDVSIGFSFR